MCPVHSKQSAILHCTQCKEAICMICKLTKHEGHATEELSVAAARSKKTIAINSIDLQCSVRSLLRKSEDFKVNERQARKKRESVKEQIQVRYGVIVAMAATYRDQALKEVEEISDSLEKDLAADTRGVQNGRDSLLQLHERVRQSLRATACDTEVLQVEKDMTRGPGSDERLRQLEAELPDVTYRPGLHGDFSNNIEDEIKRYIGSPVKLTFKSHNEVEIVRIGQCRDEECQEVFALREQEDKTIDVLYGLAGDFSKPKQVTFGHDGSRGEETQSESRITFVTRKGFTFEWDIPDWRRFGSKGDSMFSLVQNCQSGVCEISPVEFRNEDEEETCVVGPTLIEPKVHKVHSFDSTRCGSLFAVIDEDEDKDEVKDEDEDEVKDEDEDEVEDEDEDEDEDEVKDEDEDEVKVEDKDEDEDKEECSTKRSGKEDHDSLGILSRVVRLYSKTCKTPVATYIPPERSFFPTDICFYDNDILLIADWINDCVHVVTVTDNSLTFNDYLSGSGNIVRPTALNLDLDGRLLTGCGDGWILKHSADISATYKTLS